MNIGKNKLKWIILFLIVFLIVIWFLPQRTLKIQVNTNSDKEQLFYIEIKAGSTWNWHGIPGIKIQGKHLISANKIHHIRVSSNLRPWFGGMYGDKVFVTIKHPEYRKLNLVEKGYRGKLLTVTPQSWQDILDKEPELEFGYPELAYQPYDYKEQVAMGKILRAGEVTNHISWVADYYPELMREFLPVLHQLADYVNTLSIGRYDINKDLQDAILAIKNDFITIEERLEPPVGRRLPIKEEGGGTLLTRDLNGDGKLDKVNALFRTDSGNYKEMGLFVYYGEESGFSKPVKI